MVAVIINPLSNDQVSTPYISATHQPVLFSRVLSPLVEAGVGPGEFAHLVPERDSSSLTPAVENRRNHYDNPPRESNTTVAVATETRHEYEEQGGQSLRESQGSMDPAAVVKVTQQEKLVLEELVLPVTSVKCLLPGAGIPFVEGKGTVDDGNASVERRYATDGVEAEGRGRGGELSAFELQALEKARARQKGRMEAGEPQARNNPLCARIHYILICSRSSKLPFRNPTVSAHWAWELESISQRSELRNTCFTTRARGTVQSARICGGWIHATVQSVYLR